MIVLSNLEERFDRHLAQAENVRSLFIAFNDEVFNNRVLAIDIIGRLSKHNPAYVIPPLRKATMQLLSELESSTITSAIHRSLSSGTTRTDSILFRFTVDQGKRLPFSWT
jgi:FKBP12-rapamycin complex-associated protein